MLPKASVPRKPQLCGSISELAKTCKMSARTLDQWCRDGIIKKGRNGKYSTADVAAHLKKRNSDEAARRANKPASGDEGQWTERRMRALALEAESRLAVTSGELISKEEMIKHETEICSLFKRIMLSMPNQLAPLMVGAQSIQETEAKLRKWACDTLVQIVRDNS